MKKRVSSPGASVPATQVPQRKEESEEYCDLEFDPVTMTNQAADRLSQAALQKRIKDLVQNNRLQEAIWLSLQQTPRSTNSRRSPTSESLEG